MINFYLPWISLIIGGYLLGSIMFCRLICLVFFHTDICKVSKDGNPGAANAFWHCGKLAGIIGCFLDMMKGFLPVFIAIKYLDINNILFPLVILAPVLGHAFSVFHGFNGGKCIATTYGELMALFFTSTAPLFLVVFGVFNFIFEFILKSINGNKRAFIMYAILILFSIPFCIYADKVMLMIGIILISLVAIFKHTPIEATETAKRARSRI